MSDLKSIFGQNLKRIREQKLISQADFATMISKQQAYVSQLESGKKGFSPESLSEIANALDVSVWELLLPPGTKQLKLAAIDRDIAHLEKDLKLTQKLKEAHRELEQAHETSLALALESKERLVAIQALEEKITALQIELEQLKRSPLFDLAHIPSRILNKLASIEDFSALERLFDIEFTTKRVTKTKSRY